MEPMRHITPNFNEVFIDHRSVVKQDVHKVSTLIECGSIQVDVVEIITNFHLFHHFSVQVEYAQIGVGEAAGKGVGNFYEVAGRVEIYLHTIFDSFIWIEACNPASSFIGRLGNLAAEAVIFAGITGSI